MLESELDLKQLILRSTLLIFGLLTCITASLQLLSLLQQYKTPVLITFIVLSLLSVISIRAGFSPFRKIVLDPVHKMITSNYHGFFKKTMGLKNSYYSKRFTYGNHTKNEYLVIQSEDGGQFVFGSQVYKNYQELYRQVVKLSRHKKKMNVNYFKMIGQATLVYFRMLVVFSAILKLIKLSIL